MAHQQLGAEDQARTWYDKALNWQKDSTPDETLQGFYSEAAQRLANPQEERLNNTESP